MTRKIRTKSKQETVEGQVKRKCRTVTQIGEEQNVAVKQETESDQEVMIKALATGLTDTEIGVMADYFLNETEKIKKIEEAIEWIKPLLKMSAVEQDWKRKFGEVAEAKAMASSTTTFTCTVTKFVALLKKENKLKLVDDLLSIKLGDAKKYLGEETLKGLVKKVSDPKGRLSVLKKKGTK